MATVELNQLPMDVQSILTQLRSDLKVGEKHRVVNFVSRQSTSRSALANEILLLKPADHDIVLKRLRVEVIIELQQTELVINMFKEDDKTLNDIAFRRRSRRRLAWAFEKEDSPFLEVQFLEEFLAEVPFTRRRHIIKQLGEYLTSESISQRLFAILYSSYGLLEALPIIAKCSPSFISSFLHRCPLKTFPGRLMKILANSHPQIMFNYFLNYYQMRKKQSEYADVGIWLDSSTRFACFKTFMILAKKDLSQLLSMVEKYVTHMNGFTFSKALSLHLVKKHWDRIVAMPLVYCQLLNEHVISKVLGGDAVKFLVPLMPKTFMDMKEFTEYAIYNQDFTKWQKFLKHFEPVDVRAEIFMKVIEEAYISENLSRNNLPLDCISISIVPFFGAAERLLIAEHHLKSATANEISKWISVKPTAISVPEIKQLLRIATDVPERGRLLCDLISSCKINGDMDALLEVMKFITERFRNDSIEIFGSILHEISQISNECQLTSEHWSSISELLKVCLLNPEVKRIWHNVIPVLEKVVVSLLENKQSIGFYVEKIVQYNKYGSFNLESFTAPKYCILDLEKMFLLNVAEYYCKKVKSGSFDSSSESEAVQLAIRIGQALRSWNKRHPKNLISFKEFPSLLKRLQEMVSDEKHLTLQLQVMEILKTESELINPMLVYESCLKINPTDEVLNYFLSTNPQVIVKNLELIAPFILKSHLGTYRQFLLKLRYHGYNDIWNYLVQKSLHHLEDKETGRQERSQVLFILALYLTSASYIRRVENFAPKVAKIDINLENVEWDLELKEFSARHLKEIERQGEAFQLLKLFCVGDYLKFARDTLYAICRNALAKQSLDFVKSFTDSPVSLKKHIIIIYCQLNPNIQEILTFLENIWKTSDNVSIRQVVLKCLRSIVLRGSLSTARLIQLITHDLIPSLTFKDKGAINEFLDDLDQLLSITNTEDQKATLLSICAKVFEPENGAPTQERIDDQVKNKLIQIIGQNHFLLPDELISELAKRYFFTNKEFSVSDEFVETIARILLIRGVDSAARLLHQLLDIMTTSISAVDGSEEQNRVALFVKTICIQSFEKTQTKRESEQFLPLLDELLGCSLLRKPSAVFDERFWIQVAIAFHKFGDNVFKVGNCILEIFNDYLSKYGNQILMIFIGSLTSFLKTCHKLDNLTCFQLSEGLINFSLENSDTHISTELKILVLQIFPATCPPSCDKHLYNSVSKLLLKSTSEVEEIFVSRWKKSKLSNSISNNDW